jgi:AcrR family transcriptional regulator
VVEAARKIIAHDGVDGLTMRRLSNELGVTLGATYRHVPSKRDVLLLVARDLYAEAQLPVKGPWEQRLKRLMIDVALTMSAHPGMATFITGTADETLPADLHRAVVTVLREAGFSNQGVDTVIAALFFYVHGTVASGLMSGGEGGTSQARVRRLVERGLDLLLAGAKVTLLDP